MSEFWPAILAEVDRIKTEECAGHTGSSRSQEWTGADGRSALTILSASMPDGETRVFIIEASLLPGWDRTGPPHITVRRSVHCNENYWDQQVARDPETRVVIDGNHFRLGRNGDKPSPHNGYAGARFDIEFFDGRSVTTYDLWSQGPVPAKYRPLLPDNARFVS